MFPLCLIDSTASGGIRERPGAEWCWAFFSPASAPSFWNPLQMLRLSSWIQLLHDWLYRHLVWYWFSAITSWGRGCESAFLYQHQYFTLLKIEPSGLTLGHTNPLRCLVFFGSGCFISPVPYRWGCSIQHLRQAEIPRNRRPKIFVCKLTGRS